ncbi:glycosyltransferase family 4 protein [Nonlabens ulvanivorans]|uniref:Glycosyltransferase involved in cell wall biosynthesis n=1 Tax=Nonlabens ulvanivorans TaxID=906888 RepID=A0A084JY55_NONUL|nr:glycosyltransferase family 4 protein [Nonlabens ulvanivorans]KEZ93889.1 hypothetical protein IL45_06740 [Nonlabens ulvanivorans]PRX14497.1 glycosyltransferase involved in cell wall biosynthesis [Nonlabens ulvanivorans]
MKILHLNGHRPYGGNEQQLIDIAQAMMAHGVENHVFLLPHGILKQKLVEFPSFVIHESPRKYKSRSSQKMLRDLATQIKPDLIHLHTSNAITLFYFAYLFHKLEIPVVMSKKGMSASMSFLSKFKYNFYKIDKILCISTFIKVAMENVVMFKKNYHKLEIITDGVLRERCESQSALVEDIIVKNDTSIHVVNIANHNAAKDLETLIKTIDYTVNHLGYKDFKVHQFGYLSKLTEQLNRQISEYKIQDYIQFYGFTDNASGYLQSFDIFIMSSEREGGPSAVLEAMCHGLPVISTNVGVIPDAINNGVNGYVVPVKDFKKMATSLVELANNTQLRKQFSRNAIDIFNSNFTAQKVALQTYELYKTIIENKNYSKYKI